MRRQATCLGVVLVLGLAGCANTSPAAPTTSASSAVVPTVSTTSLKPSTTTSSATPTPTTVLSPGDAKPEVRAVQARLRQLDFFTSYDVLDNYGPMTTEAVAAYQKSKGLEPTGVLDSATWKQLQADTKEPSQAELTNQIPGPAIIAAGSKSLKELQVRLQGSGYAGPIDGTLSAAVVTAIKSFQTAQQIPVTGEVDQRTWDYLVGSTPTPAQWQLDGKSEPPAPTGGTMALSEGCKAAIAASGRGFCAAESQHKLVFIQNNQVVATFDAVFGRPGMPTTRGRNQVYYKSAHGVTSTMFGSAIPMPYSMCFDGNECIHYSVDFAKYGFGVQSHGCIGVRDLENMKIIFDQAQVGDVVYVDD